MRWPVAAASNRGRPRPSWGSWRCSGWSSGSTAGGVRPGSEGVGTYPRAERSKPHLSHAPPVFGAAVLASEVPERDGDAMVDRGVAAAGAVPAQLTPLPAGLAEALGAFEIYLRDERAFSVHTVRAYLGDITRLLHHASRSGVSD